jgi:hypothetical protein
MAARGSSGGESKQGIVVTLVFFILATIGLGVATYYGFAEQDKLKGEAKKKEQEAKAADEERNTYMGLYGLARAHLGMPVPDDSRVGRELPVRKTAFDQGNFGLKDAKELELARKFVADLEARSKWIPDKARPTQTVDDRINALDAQVKRLTTDLEAAVQARKTAEDERKQAQENLDKAEAKYKDAIAKLEGEFKTKYQEYAQKLVALEDKLKKSVEAKSPVYLAAIEDKLTLQKENAGLKTQLNTERSKVADMELKLATRPEEIAARDVPLRPLGEVARVHSSLRRATINLGRVDGVTVGTTFSVHSMGNNGKPKPRSKGSIEVVSVGDRSSDVAITTMFHPDDPGDPISGKRKEIDVLDRSNRDPIIRGDKLINPLWTPNRKTHIAIAGYLDFGAYGILDINSFARLLERQNVIVDAYIDPADGKVKGPGLDRRTDYLIVGNGFAPSQFGVPRDTKTVKALNATRDGLLKEARAIATPLINQRQFMQKTGFTIPRNVERD